MRDPSLREPIRDATRGASRTRRTGLCLGASVCLAVLVLVAGAQTASALRSRHGAGGASSGADAPAQEGHGLPFHVMQRPGYLGVSLRDLDAAEATRLHRRGAMGAMIITVDRDAPAWGAGLRPQDVVLEIDGQPVDGVEMLRRRLRECTPGESVTLRVRRGEDEMSYAVTLGDQDKVAQNAVSRHLRPGASAAAVSDPPNVPDNFAFAGPGPAPQGPSRGMASTLFDALIPGSSYTGLEVDPLTPQLAAFFGVRSNGGLLVTAVNSGSPAAGAGLVAGDVILRAANRPVATRSSLAHALRAAKGNAVALAVLHDHKELILSLAPEKRKKL